VSSEVLSEAKISDMSNGESGILRASRANGIAMSEVTYHPCISE